MKIIREPSVYVIGRQVVDESNLKLFLKTLGVEWESDSEIPAEILSETAGRLCYLSYAKPRPGGNAAYLEHIKESGHGSVLEHSVWTLLIAGVSRSLTHEFIRHRAGVSPSQVSQRYVDESVAEYVEPAIIAENPELHQIWLDAMTYAHTAYKALAHRLYFKFDNTNMGYTERRKAARQAARSVLPNATETKVAITANARALRNVLEQRGSRYAEPEIRKLANVMLDVLQTESPNLFGDYQRVPLQDGTFEITTNYRKV